MRKNFLILMAVCFVCLLSCNSKQDQFLSYEWYPVKYRLDNGGSLGDARYKYVKASGEELVVEGLRDASFFTSDGLSRVEFVDQEGYGYVNTKGDLTIPVAYKKATLFSEGFAWVKRLDASSDDPVEVINTKGDVVFSLPVREVRRFQEGLCAFSDGKKWGYVNAKGDVVIAAEYSDAGNFSNGLAPVVVNDKWGYIDTKGEVVIEPQYGFAGEFDANGLAVASKGRMGQGIILIDKKNVAVIEEGRYTMIANDGAIYRCAVDRKELTWCDKSGKELFAQPVSTDFSGVQSALFNDSNFAWTGTCFVNKKGEVNDELTTIGKKYRVVSPFINGVAMVQLKRDLCGLINEKGEELIVPQYEEFGFGGDGFGLDVTRF